MQNGLINHTKATEVAAVFAKNTKAIEEQLREIATLREELKGVFFGVGDFDFEIRSHDITDKWLENLAREFKRQGWRTLINKLDLRKYMSSKKQDELQAALYHSGRSRDQADPIDQFPDITEDSIMDVLKGYMDSVPEFMDEAIREEWDFWLPKRDEYKTNSEKWKVSKKIIHTYVMRVWDKWDSAHRVRHDAYPHLNNLDNIFHLLDGKGFIKTSSGPLYSAIEGNTEGQAETEYFSARMFKNGNLHLKIKRLDLLDKFNEIGCGEGTSLPNPTNTKDGGMHKPSPLDRERKPEPNTLEFFETPEAVRNAMVSIIERHFGTDCWRKLKALEPSAGDGAIANALRNNGATVYCIEFNSVKAASLDKQYKYNGCECIDFLKKKPTPALDIVAMNPPFSQGRDMLHVHHANKFLKRGGILVAVMSTHWRFGNDSTSVAFRDWAESLGAAWARLPDGAFKQSGTMVSTGLLIVKRPKEMPKPAIEADKQEQFALSGA